MKNEVWIILAVSVMGILICMGIIAIVRAGRDQHQILFRIGRDMEQLIMNGCQNATSKELLNIVCELGLVPGPLLICG